MLLIVSIAGLWLVVASLCLMVVALSRQIGLLHKRLAPDGARMMADGPAIGAVAPPVDVIDISGRRFTLGVARRKQTLLVFLSPGCTACADLIPAVKAVFRSERRTSELAFVSLATDEAVNRRFIDTHTIQDIPFVANRELAEIYGVKTPPYAVLVDADGKVAAKGLVNHLEHVESLLTAAKVGHPTMESYRYSQQTPMLQGESAARVPLSTSM